MPIPDIDHVARYCSPIKIGPDGHPASSAFLPRKGESSLSVNWLEYFETRDIDASIKHVASAFVDKGYTIKPSGSFAILEVGTARRIVEDLHNTMLNFEHLPEPNDPSHAGITGYGSEDIAIATELSDLVGREDVRAVP